MRNKDQGRDPSPESICKFISKIKENSGKAPAILNLLQNTYMPEDFYECNEKSATKSNKATSTHSNGIMKEKLMQFSSRKDVVATLENEVQEIFTPNEICHIDAITEKQWKCLEWYVLKAGIISASKAKKVMPSLV